MDDNRVACLKQFYSLLDNLEQSVGGKRVLTDSHGRMDWPKRGVYFFFEAGEGRSQSGFGPRVVRVGTHAVSANSGSTLWGRLASHRGSSMGSGNHRSSIFRLLLGEALACRDNALSCATWGQGNSAAKVIRDEEVTLECSVTRHLSQMPFLWLEADDTPSAESIRGYIERNSIALLSNYGKRNSIALLSNYGKNAPIDPPSLGWLGKFSSRPTVRESGLWNQNYVGDGYEPEFIETFASFVTAHRIK